MPAKKTRAKKAQEKKKKQAKEMPSPSTPPADGRSPFSKLPIEVHFLIGDALKENKHLRSLASVARTSRRFCSYYEQQLYKGKTSSSNIIQALMWGARRGSIHVMKCAIGWGADLNTRTDIYRFRPYSIDSKAQGTALQLAIRSKQDDAMDWLFKQGVLVDLPNEPARNLCLCGAGDGGWDGDDSWASTLHIAVCTDNLSAVKMLLRDPHEATAAVEFSQKFDHDLILHTAVYQAFNYRSVNILNAVLKNSMIRSTINDFKPEAHPRCTPLAMALTRGASESRYPYSRAKEILAALVKAGADLGPYPPGSWQAGKSPLMDEVQRGNLRTNARYLLELGCDPDGDRPNPVTPDWQSPLLAYIVPQHENIFCRPPYKPSILPQWHGHDHDDEIKDFIPVLLAHGASLDITDSDGCSPLRNALGYMAPHLKPSLRVMGLKLVKFLLANATTDKNVSEKSRKEAEDAMAALTQDLRADHATHYISYHHEA